MRKSLLKFVKCGRLEPSLLSRACLLLLVILQTAVPSFLTILLTVATVLVAGSSQAGPYKGFPRGHALIEADELEALLDRRDPTLVVIAAVEQVSWLLGRISGARPAPRGDYTGGNGMAVERAHFQEFARQLGIDDDSTVVVYDDVYDAARLWWLFYLYGKTDVRVLDGGWAAWKEAGYGVERGPALTVWAEGSFTAESALSGWTAEIADVHRARSDRAIHVWDARDKREWDGAARAAGVPGGRIGWARFVGWRAFRVAADGKPAGFRTAAEIDALLGRVGIDPGHDHIFYCHSGVRSATPVLALYLMGYLVERLHNYDGSWLEWSGKAAAMSAPTGDVR